MVCMFVVKVDLLVLFNMFCFLHIEHGVNGQVLRITSTL